ncbi:MAG: 16S rRNA (uracil(1498)-N(3))-methyltransferase [Treponema sp.]|jgi:RsmE family RNA methyltransferase|nr:16S rRNA (uracil(1498)-N(3))-methyltransferase [Treponema sp.]
MNLILFEAGELSWPEHSGGPAHVSLSRRDTRAAHLLKVLRKKEGDGFDAGVVDGKLGVGTIVETSAAAVRCSLELDTAPPPRTPVRLAAGFSRPIQLRRMFRDMASLGLSAIDLAGTELGEKSYRDTKLLDDGGARAALLEGAAQARDTRLPKLALYPSLAVWLAARPWDGDAAGRPMLVAADNVTPAGSFAGLEHGDRAVLAVGSERGWSGAERELLDRAGFRRLSMGSRALRTETACTAAVILLMEKLGCLQENCRE